MRLTGLMIGILVAWFGPASAASVQWSAAARQDAIVALMTDDDQVPVGDIFAAYLPGHQIVVYILNANWCGSAGCSLMAFQETTLGWRKVGTWSAGPQVDYTAGLLRIDNDRGWRFDSTENAWKPRSPEDADREDFVPPTH